MKVNVDLEVDSRPALLRALVVSTLQTSEIPITCCSMDQNTAVVAQQVAIAKSALACWRLMKAVNMTAWSSENVTDVGVLVSDEDGSLSRNMTIRVYVFMRQSLEAFRKISHIFFMKVDSDFVVDSRSALRSCIFLHAVAFSTLQTTSESLCSHFLLESGLESRPALCHFLLCAVVFSKLQTTPETTS